MLFRNMILVQIILRKITPGNDDLFKVICNYDKVQQKLASQRTKGESKASFNFAVILCK